MSVYVMAITSLWCWVLCLLAGFVSYVLTGEANRWNGPVWQKWKARSARAAEVAAILLGLAVATGLACCVLAATRGS